MNLVPTRTGGKDWPFTAAVTPTLWKITNKDAGFISISKLPIGHLGDPQNQNKEAVLCFSRFLALMLKPTV